jgi:hypothetical protein
MITTQNCHLRSDLGFRCGAPSATRTRDLLLRRQLLYPLSYRGQPGQGDNLLAAAKPNRSAAIPRWPMRGAALQPFAVPAGG